MTALVWDETGQRFFETGVDHGVLYIPENGVYSTGVAWNGLTTVTESPSGAESSPQYADNIKYLNLVSAEEFGATIEAFTYPDEFEQFDGIGVPAKGIAVGQQPRKPFGFAYRTNVGNDTEGQTLGYKIHLVYGAQAAPSERAYSTINDSPEAITFSWEVTTTPVPVPGYKPTALITIDSVEVDPDGLSQLEKILYGSDSDEPRLPLPDEVLTIFGGVGIVVTPNAPTFDSASNTITIPSQTGVVYSINGVAVTGTAPITSDTTVTATASSGYSFTTGAQTQWTFAFNDGTTSEGGNTEPGPVLTPAAPVQNGNDVVAPTYDSTQLTYSLIDSVSATPETFNSGSTYTMTANSNVTVNASAVAPATLDPSAQTEWNFTPSETSTPATTGSADSATTDNSTAA